MQAFAPLIIIALVAVVMVYFNKKVHFDCPICGCAFKVSGLTFAFAPHRMGARLITCPNCGSREMMTPIPDRKE